MPRFAIVLALLVLASSWTPEVHAEQWGPPPPTAPTGSTDQPSDPDPESGTGAPQTGQRAEQPESAWSEAAQLQAGRVPESSDEPEPGEAWTTPPEEAASSSPGAEPGGSEPGSANARNQGAPSQPEATTDPESEQEARSGPGELDPREYDRLPPEERVGLLSRLFNRFEFHGYARMPLNLHFRPVDEGEETAEISRDVPFRIRSPFLVDNDYYLSGFAYTRLCETDWVELFFSAGGEDIDITVGLFASLLSDWAYTSVDRQFGLAQASINWRNVGGLRPLSIKAGMFWDRLGFIEPYDTYIFGRTHQAGLRLGWDFPSGAMVRAGVGAHLEVLQQNQGFTPIVYAYGGSPIGPVELRAYVLFVWNDDVRALTTMEEGDLLVFGADARVDFPWFDGPLYVALAGYWAERALFLANAFELLHSTGGRGLTENFLGIQDSENGTGSIVSGAVDWPIQIWRGLGVRFFGMLAHVWSEQQSDDPMENRDDRTYVKWGIEPSYQALPWLRASVRYDRVILDMGLPGLGFRAITPALTFTAYRGVDLVMAYTHYFYGEDITLRPNQIPGYTEPDEDVLRIMARATW